MKTAVDWLKEQYYESEGKLTRCDFEQAKQKEKEQIIDAGNKCQIYNDGFIYEDAEQYYNQTYNQNK
jgi:hypothetical protein